MAKEPSSEDERLVFETFARQEAEKAARLAAAIRTAEEQGKERFDLEKLERMYDIRGPYSTDPVRDRDAVREDLEYRYYVNHPEIRTLAEFAARLEEYDTYAS